MPYGERMTRILIVEDDDGIRTALKRGFTERGDSVIDAPDGLTGLNLAVNQDAEVVLLDLGLPDVDGLRVLAMIRAVSAIPVIVITAQDDDATIVKALDAGADDYIVKPFGTEEVAARIRAVLRRTARDAAEPKLVSVGELTLDPRKREASFKGESMTLTRKEFDLLFLLASRVGEVITRRELLAEVWQQPVGGADRTVDVHLSWLRRKLGETANEPRYLVSVRGVGVRMVDPTAGDWVE